MRQGLAAVVVGLLGTWVSAASAQTQPAQGGVTFQPQLGQAPQPFQPPQGELALLTGSANPEFARKIAKALGVKLTPCEAHYFSEGNVFVRILENVRGRDCFIIQGVHQPVNDNFVELLFWIDALRRASAQHCAVTGAHIQQHRAPAGECRSVLPFRWKLHTPVIAQQPHP